MAAKVDLNSSIGQIYDTPIGHDILKKVLLQAGVSERLIKNPIVRNIKFLTFAKLMGKKNGRGLAEGIIELVNTDREEVIASKGAISRKWWKEAVFYQIYPRSFCDSDGDGIGDLKGIISKLDYLKDLGVDVLWLSPIYDSPNDDNGYDIRDYRKIMKEFGSMEDFDRLLEGVHERGMKLIMDLVVNHTSDEHEWFKEALKDKNSPYRDYYFFRKGKGEGLPNNWTSFFSGDVWNKYEDSDGSDIYAMHLFSKKQMDLNWDNEKVRDDVRDMINWWFDKGIDGFRMDVINIISKAEGLPDGDPVIGSMMGLTGIEKYYYGPNLHKYLRELHEKAFAPHNAFSVGETPGLGMNMCRFVTAEERGELDMVFSFDHLETPGHVRYEDYEYDLNFLKKYLMDWSENYGNNCWMSLFYNNHDNPRMVSKVTKDKTYSKAIAGLLAVIQMTMKGTPFIYQGDEMGLTNYDFSSMDQITDVEAKGYYREHEKEGKEKTWKEILAGTREHTRVLLPWNDRLPEYHKGLRQEIDRDITEAYRELIALRHSDDTLVYGELRLLDGRKNHFVYERVSEKGRFVIDCNLSKKEIPAYRKTKGLKLIYSTKGREAEKRLKPYEARIWYV